MSTVMAAAEQLTRPARQQRRADRRRLRRQDALSRELAELHEIRMLLERATEVVGAGWVQDAWFVVATPGGERRVTAYDLQLVTERPVVGACLVGAVVHAAGGPATVRSQLVQRTLDVAWHALREEPERSVQWCPAPPVRRSRLLDLTRWNDACRRRQDDVVELLLTARRVTDAQRGRCLAEQALLARAVDVPAWS